MDGLEGKNLEPTTRFELVTLGLRIWQHSGNSLILRHGWRPKSRQNHVRNAQVVPILYSWLCLVNTRFTVEFNAPSVFQDLSRSNRLA
jgi:hypothetical protein